MLMLRLLGFFLIGLLLSGCEDKDPLHHKQRKAVVHGDSSRIIEFYRGTIPCVDCRGIVQQLWLLKKHSSDNYGMFMLRETYLTGDTALEQIINSRGAWEVTNEKGIRLLILQCDRDLSCGTKYFELQDQRIIALDKEKQPIQSAVNYSLQRVD